MPDKVNQGDFPRITLKCSCGNEFIVNVMRLRSKQPVVCQICDQIFSDDLSETFAKALEDLYKIKYQLEKDNYPFHFSFKYKSSYSQPPVPYSFDDKDLQASAEKEKDMFGR